MMYAELKQKICTRCKIPKSVIDFYKDKGQTSGLSPCCKRCKWQSRSVDRKNNPEFYKKVDFVSDIKKRYGLSMQDYEKLYQSQQGQCACCYAPESAFKRGFHIDHDHVTGQVRGLLCTKCNPGLGYFDDSIEKLEMGIAYLRKFKK